DISPLIVYPIIDCLLGGSNADLFIPQRPLTDIEWRLVGRVTDRAIEGLSEAWSVGQEVCFELTERESNAHLLPIVASEEMVAVVAIELKMGTRTGSMSLCFPFTVVEPVLDTLMKKGGGGGQDRFSGSHREQIETNLKSADVIVRAYLAGATITLNDLIRLQPGDIVQTCKSCDSELMLQVGGQNKFAGKLYKYKGFRAIRITRRAEPNEPL
ncbi:MAG: flagellar motor switch protein FliM, partial [Planctomycetota bacterium]